MIGQQGGGLHRVGDDGQSGVAWDECSDGEGGRPGVEQDRTAGRDLVEGSCGDPPFLRGRPTRAGGERLLEALDRDRPAVYPAQRAALLQGGQVAAHGLGSDPERVGEIGDGDSSGPARLVDDPAVTITARREPAVASAA